MAHDIFIEYLIIFPAISLRVLSLPIQIEYLFCVPEVEKYEFNGALLKLSIVSGLWASFPFSPQQFLRQAGNQRYTFIDLVSLFFLLSIQDGEEN